MKVNWFDIIQESNLSSVHKHELWHELKALELSVSSYKSECKEYEQMLDKIDDILGTDTIGLNEYVARIKDMAEKLKKV